MLLESTPASHPATSAHGPRLRFPVLLLLALCTALTSAAGDDSPPAPTPPLPATNFREPRREYETVHLGDWTVCVEAQLQREDPELTRAALARLEAKLGVIARMLPAHSLPVLKKLPIYLMFGSRATGGGQDSGAAYHQKTAPKFHRNLDERWGSSVVIYSAHNYVKLSELWSVKVLVHEFAHAYQLEQWPEKQPDILAAWENARQHDLYLHVKDTTGREIEKGYASVNQLEYFAELSCMYFAGCNYQPFNRTELRTYDPVGFAMIEKMWRVAATAQSGASPEAGKSQSFDLGSWREFAPGG